MTRRRVAVVTGIVLVASSVAGIALAADGGGDDDDSIVAATEVPSTSTTPVAVTSTSSAATTTTSATTTTVVRTTTTTEPPVPTLAPIPTFDARVGADVGSLTSTAVTAPVRVVIPSLGADGPVAPTGVNDLGELAIPAEAGQLVWWQFGPTPGAPGSAVIAGHLDWKGRLGVFNRLAETPIGERITVTYADGHESTFVVTSVDLVDKPAVAVNGTFARGGDPVLRLVTCGGEFDRSTCHYRSNVIVTAVPA